MSETRKKVFLILYSHIVLYLINAFCRHSADIMLSEQRESVGQLL